MVIAADIRLHPMRNRAMYEVAKLAYEGRLEEAEYLPYKVITGTIPTLRCCVYKEREIFRQRVRVAMNKPAGDYEDGNIIQIIEPACADCPISSYVVTNNCQNCMGKACLSSCRFDAIHPDRHQSVIDSNKCKECGACARACPYNAIAHLERPCKKSCPVSAITYNENGLAVINEDKCIKCGACVLRCPFGAIGTRDNIVEVIDMLKSDREVYAMIAPASEGQFGERIGMASIRNAMIELGFADCYEVGVGADLTAAAESEEWLEAYKSGGKKTTSCCPAFVNMINKHFPELAEYISSAVSPMCATSRLIKTLHPGAATVFIGPCVAKKSEISDHKLEGNADYAIGYHELRAIMKAAEVEFEETADSYQTCSLAAKNFASAGGVANACVQYLREAGVPAEELDGMSIARVCGGDECRKALKQLKAGKLPAQFIEGMACEGGCIGGPASHDDHTRAMKNRKFLINDADARTIHESLADVECEVEMHR